MEQEHPPEGQKKSRCVEGRWRHDADDQARPVGDILLSDGLSGGPGEAVQSGPGFEFLDGLPGSFGESSV